MAAITWWTLPHSFGGMVVAENNDDGFETKLFKAMILDGYPTITTFLENYIDATGSQQYWDFFAPQSPKYHQYLSVCRAIIADPDQGKISCKDNPLFTNLDDGLESNADRFKAFGSDRSRLYRLTENLVKLEEPELLNAFTRYFHASEQGKLQANAGYHLILHQFELHPELKALPKSGYRMDKVLLINYQFYY
jgi:hypothetical protein